MSNYPLKNLSHPPEAGNDSAFSQEAISPHILKKGELDQYIVYTANIFVNEKQLFRKFNGETYMLNGIIYQPLNEEVFYNLAYHYALLEGIILKPAHCRQLLESVKIRVCESSQSPDNEYYTVFRNGLVSNIDGTLSKIFLPDYFATIYV